MSIKRILVYFPHEVRPLLDDIHTGSAPRERMYGFYELLEEEDVEITFCEERHRGVFGYILGRAKHFGLNPAHPSLITRISKTNLIVIKDNFSFTTSLLAKLFGKNVIYYDSLYPIPKNSIKQYLNKLCIRWAIGLIGYSQDQAIAYSNFADISIDKFKTITWALDPTFYVPTNVAPSENRVLSIGRDNGRDFETLINAVRTSDFKLDLVTLPYLIRNEDRHIANITIHERIPYSKLFHLYGKAKTVVIPIKDGIDYPSGLRAIHEAMAMQRPVIISGTKYVRNNFIESDILKFVRPNDEKELLNAIASMDINSDKTGFKRCTGDYVKTVTEVKNYILNRAGNSGT